MLQMLATSIILASALVASHHVDVRSSTNCPSSQAIAERLRPLLPGGPAQSAAADTAIVEPVDTRADELRIRLLRPGGAVVGDRRVAVPADCAQAAITVAAVIAAWKIEPPPPAADVGPTPIAVSASGTAASSTWQASPGAGGGVGLVGGVAGVGRIEVLAGRRSSRLQGRIGFVGETTRALSLASGRVDWRHTTFEAGLVLRTLHPQWPASVEAALTLGWATLAGRGFSPNRRQRSFEYGAGAAARLGRSFSGWSLWTEVRTYAWMREQRALLTGDETRAVVPRLDVTASLGISVPLFR